MSLDFNRVPDDHFDGLRNITDRETGLAALLNENMLSQSRVAQQIYVDADAGSDSNSGKYPDRAFQNIPTALALIAHDVKHLTVVNLRGTFEDIGVIQFRRHINEGGKIIIDGGDELTEVVAEITSDINSASSIGLTTAGWTADAYAGYWVEITSGALIGQKRLIQENSTTIITPQRNFSADPGAGAKFRIVRPATTIQGSNNNVLDFTIHGSPANGTDLFAIQRLYLTGSAPYIKFDNCSATAIAAGIVNNSTRSTGAFNITGGHGRLVYTLLDPADGSYFASTAIYAGPSQINASGNITIADASQATLGLFARKLNVNGSLILMAYGTRVKGQCTLFTPVVRQDYDSISSTSGFAATKIDGSSGIGLQVVGGHLRIKDPVISNNGSHGIEVTDGATLKMTGAVGGTGNTTTGCYCHNGSRVLINSGAVPTITTGSVELSFDGSTQKAAWATVASTPQVESTTDLLLAKAY